MAHLLPNLAYAPNALEPYIDEQTMIIHHDKHHAAYTNKLNDALEGGEFQDFTVAELLAKLDDIPEKIRQVVRNNGGGYVNHNLFWEILGPDGGGVPADGEFVSAIDKTFGGFEVFKEKFSNAAATRFGSGWAWLVLTKEGKLDVYSTPNQDSPYSRGDRPILGLDVWEHAYYLKYQNRRPDYIKAFWNVVDWEKVAENFTNAKTDLTDSAIF